VCPYCKSVGSLGYQDLKDKLVKVDIDIDDKFTEYRGYMEEVTGCKTVPKRSSRTGCLSAILVQTLKQIPRGRIHSSQPIMNRSMRSFITPIRVL
jgi:hypothetical protein